MITKIETQDEDESKRIMHGNALDGEYEVERWKSFGMICLL